MGCLIMAVIYIAWMFFAVAWRLLKLLIWLAVCLIGGILRILCGRI